MAGAKVHPPWVPYREPYHPPDYDDRVIYAVRAFANGKATEGQQLIFWRWLRYITELDGMPYRPGGADGSRDTDFASGKMFVGQQITKMLHPELTPSDEEKAAKEAARKSPKRMR